ATRGAPLPLAGAPAVGTAAGPGSDADSHTARPGAPRLGQPDRAGPGPPGGASAAAGAGQSRRRGRGPAGGPGAAPRQHALRSSLAGTAGPAGGAGGALPLETTRPPATGLVG